MKNRGGEPGPRVVLLIVHLPQTLSKRQLPELQTQKLIATREEEGPLQGNSLLLGHFLFEVCDVGSMGEVTLHATWGGFTHWCGTCGG